MYSITSVPRQKLICARLSGFFAVEEVVKFGRAVQETSIALGCGPDEHLLLVDTTGCVLQSQEVVAAFQKLIQDSPLKSRRLAILCGDSLSRMQARRILMREGAMLFDNEQEAERWLLSGEKSQQAA